MFDRDKDGFIDTDEFKTVTSMKMKITFFNIPIVSVFSYVLLGAVYCVCVHRVFFNSPKNDMVLKIIKG